MTSFGVTAVVATPEGGRGIGIWPVALATATLMVTPRPAARLWVPLLALIATVTIWAGGRPVDVAVGLGVGLAAEVWVTWRIVCLGRRERPPLETVPDLARFLVSVTAGALVMAAASILTSLVTGWGAPLLLALTTGTSSLAAQLTLLPFFCRFRNHPPLAGPVERWAQWTLLLAVTVAVFMPTDFPFLVLLVLPVLAWGALRNGSYEALAQMAVAVGISLPITTYGHGPFARPDQRFDVPLDLQGIMLATFAAVCALVVLALRLTVGEQHENARQVVAERDRMRNVVDGIDQRRDHRCRPRGPDHPVQPRGPAAARVRPRTRCSASTRGLLHSSRGVAEKAAELGVAERLLVRLARP